MAVQHLEALTITAARVNDHGIQALDGTWYNISKFADLAECPLPVAGQAVTVHLDGKAFVRRVEFLSEPPDANNAVKLGGDSEKTTSDTSHPAPIGTKDLQIARMNALAHAVAIVGHNAHERPLKLDDVLACAGQIEAWITRPA